VEICNALSYCEAKKMEESYQKEDCCVAFGTSLAG
jgi:hypothetical protein